MNKTKLIILFFIITILGGWNCHTIKSTQKVTRDSTTTTVSVPRDTTFIAPADSVETSFDFPVIVPASNDFDSNYKNSNKIAGLTGATGVMDSRGNITKEPFRDTTITVHHKQAHVTLKITPKGIQVNAGCDTLGIVAAWNEKHTITVKDNNTTIKIPVKAGTGFWDEIKKWLGYIFIAILIFMFGYVMGRVVK